MSTNAITWIFSGIGVFALGLIGRALKHVWDRRKQRDAPSAPPPAASEPEKAPADAVESRLTKPTPDDINSQVQSLPPYQQENGWNAYLGLTVCWQALFQGISEDEPAHNANPKGKKKWVVDLKHYNPAIHYSSVRICCPGIDTDEYPQFKFIHENELVIVTGKIEGAKPYWVLVFPTRFEFSGKRV